MDSSKLIGLLCLLWTDYTYSQTIGVTNIEIDLIVSKYISSVIYCGLKQFKYRILNLEQVGLLVQTFASTFFLTARIN